MIGVSGPATDMPKKISTKFHNRPNPKFGHYLPTNTNNQCNFFAKILTQPLLKSSNEFESYYVYKK
jgi:hypothetical protein